ncbi:MAG: SAM-dependent DNA methyltransferase [Dehalococcoidia bacterium]|nr:SAM-dependent DNA methyltransferase [Dehalococcoidia bacterium]
MNTRTHAELVNFIWGICNLLRGPYKRNEYRKVILPLTVLRRFDCLLAPTKEAVLAADAEYRGRDANVRRGLLERASGRSFYNTSKMDFPRLLDDPNHLAQNLASYIKDFSPNVREIMERFAFDQQIARMDEKNLLFEVVKAFAGIDLSPDDVDNVQMGYVFEELIRIGAEQANEEAGEHFTPREVIRLMVSLLLSPEPDLGRGHVVKTIYDPACGTGGMLSVAEEYLREHNRESNPILYGQDWNDEAWAVCKSDMLIKGENAENIVRDDTFTKDGYARRPDGSKYTFDYMLANPPFGVEWKQQQREIERERDTLGYQGRFGAGLPRVDDGALLFLQHMLAKMQPIDEGGSRLAIVFNGSPLFTGDAGQGASNIRQWIIENDWLEAIVALPDQLFYNTGISTYIWVLTNRKEAHRKGKVQLIDGRQFFVKMRKSLGNKRNQLSEDQIADLTRIHGNFQDGESREFTDEDPVTHLPRRRARTVSKVFANEDFGYRKVTVERPLRLNFAATTERIARLEEVSAFRNLATSKKRAGKAHDEEVAAGRQRQETIRGLLHSVAEATSGEVFRDREAFLAALSAAERAAGVRLVAPERKAVLSALGERDPDAAVCCDRHGNPEPDAELRDTEMVSLLEDVEAYMAREVLPHVSDAWVEEGKTKFGYEISFNRLFYVYEPPRTLDEIEGDLRDVEGEIIQLLSGVMA